MLYLGLSIPYEGQQMVYQGLLGTEYGYLWLSRPNKGKEMVYQRLLRGVYGIPEAEQATLVAGDDMHGGEQAIQGAGYGISWNVQAI